MWSVYRFHPAKYLVMCVCMQARSAKTPKGFSVSSLSSVEDSMDISNFSTASLSKTNSTCSDSQVEGVIYIRGGGGGRHRLAGIMV